MNPLDPLWVSIDPVRLLPLLAFCRLSLWPEWFGYQLHIAHNSCMSTAFLFPSHCSQENNHIPSVGCLKCYLLCIIVVHYWSLSLTFHLLEQWGMSLLFRSLLPPGFCYRRLNGWGRTSGERRAVFFNKERTGLLCCTGTSEEHWDFILSSLCTPMHGTGFIAIRYLSGVEQLIKQTNKSCLLHYSVMRS